MIFSWPSWWKRRLLETEPAAKSRRRWNDVWCFTRRLSQQCHNKLQFKVGWNSKQKYFRAGMQGASHMHPILGSAQCRKKLRFPATVMSCAKKNEMLEGPLRGSLPIQYKKKGEDQTQPFHGFRYDSCIRRALVLILTGLLFSHARASTAPFPKYSLPKKKMMMILTSGETSGEWRTVTSPLVMPSVHRCRFAILLVYRRWLSGLRVFLPFCNLSLVPFGSWYFLLTVAASRSSSTLAPERLIGIFWFFPLQARATGWSQSPMLETNVRTVHCNWLYKKRVLERFLRVIQKIPIRLSGVKIVELRDAATMSKKYQEPQGTRDKLQKAKAHEERIANVDTPVNLQSDIYVPKASQVERSRFVTPLVSSLLSINIIFGWGAARHEQTDARRMHES